MYRLKKVGEKYPRSAVLNIILLSFSLDSLYDPHQPETQLYKRNPATRLPVLYGVLS